MLPEQAIRFISRDSHDAPGNGKLAEQHGCWCKLELRTASLAPEAVQPPFAQSLSPAPGKRLHQRLALGFLCKGPVVTTVAQHAAVHDVSKMQMTSWHYVPEPFLLAANHKIIPLPEYIINVLRMGNGKYHNCPKDGLVSAE